MLNNAQLKITLLTASYNDGEYVNTYAFKTTELANLFGMHLINEYVEGDWRAYRKADVKELKIFIKRKEYDAARTYWNGMSTFTLTIEEDVPVETDVPNALNFHWK